MRKAFEEGTCTFCSLDRTLNTVLWEDDYAMVWKVPEAYLRDTLALHALVVPKRHVRFEADLTDEEALSMHHATQFVRNTLGYSGGLAHTREGPMDKNSGTVDHLHKNIFEVNKTGEVRVPVYKDPGDSFANKGRAAEFASWYDAGKYYQ